MKSITRRSFLKALGYGSLGTAVSPNLSFGLPQNLANSEIFLVKDIPIPIFAESNRHLGIDALLSLMGNHETKFYKSHLEGLLSGLHGFIDKNDVVLIKVNGQWRTRGSTNSDILRGIIQIILDHPDGFLGEIVIIENGQSQGSMDGRGGGWGTYPGIGIMANAENINHTFNFIVNEIYAGYPVSTLLMDSMRTNYLSDDDHENNGYRKLGIVSYPCFTTKNGNRVELAKGVWKDGSYMNNLKLINIPVLKTHGGSGITGALKHTYGILTTDHSPVNYHYTEIGQVVGNMFAFALPPTLNIMDMIWISHKSLSGYPESTTNRQNKLAASFDPVALDFYTCKYVLYPVSKNPNHHPEMTDQYRDSNFGFFIHDAAQLINDNGGLMEKAVTDREANMTPFEMTNPPQVQIKLNKTELVPGSDLKVSTRITNPGYSKDVDFYFAIKIGNSYYFYPDWGTSPTPNRKSLTDNSNPTFEELLSLPISDQTPAGSYTFAAAITEPGTTNIFGFLDYQSFAIRSATTSQINFLDTLKKG